MQSAFNIQLNQSKTKTDLATIVTAIKWKLRHCKIQNAEIERNAAKRTELKPQNEMR